MNGSLLKLLRMMLPLGSLMFCVSLMAMPTPGYQENQPTAPDNTKANRDQTGPIADQQKMNPTDRAKKLRNDCNAF